MTNKLQQLATLLLGGGERGRGGQMSAWYEKQGKNTPLPTILNCKLNSFTLGSTSPSFLSHLQCKGFVATIYASSVNKGSLNDVLLCFSSTTTKIKQTSQAGIQ